MKIRGVTDTTRNICTVAKILKKRKIDMREILFRGKNVDNGAWVYGSFIPDMLEVFCITDIDGFIKPFSLNKEELTEVRVERSTVGQFTGLTDKNGTKIFEGDILKGLYANGNAEVEMINGSWVGYAGKGWTDIGYVVDRVELIGNVHDNPELLQD